MRRALGAARDVLAREWPLLLVTTAALVLRAWNLDFSPSAPRARPDEELFAVAALKMFSGDGDPHWAHLGFPELFFRVVHWAQVAYAWWLELTSGSRVNLGCLYALDPIRVTRLGRIVSCVAGTATVPVTALLTRRLAPAGWSPSVRRSAGTLAAMFLAFCYLHARDSHFGVSDATLVLLVTAGLWLLVVALESGRTSAWIGAGALLGLAMSTKWAALGALPACAFAVLWRVVAVRGERLRSVGGGLAAIVAGAAGFLAGSPHFVDEPEAFWTGILSHQQRYADTSGWGYDASASVVHGLEHHLLVTLPLALGWPLFAISLAGLVFAIVSRRGPLTTVAIFVLVFHAGVLGPTTLVILRYAMPLLPPLAALAAIVVAWLVDRFVRARGGSGTTGGRVGWALVAPALGLLLVLPPMHELAGFLRVSAAPDTRDLASAWLLAHARPRERIVARGGFAAIHAVPADMVTACSEALPEDMRRRVPLHAGDDPDFARLVRRGDKTWGRAADRVIRAVSMQSGVPELAEWLVLARPLLACGEPGRAEGWVEPSATCFVERASMSPGLPSCDAFYDWLDSFYVPAAGFTGIERIGPEVRIYENVCRTHRAR